MQIVETSNEGLKRAYAVTIPAAEIAARVEGEIKKIAPQVRMPGFRPGKVPANLVKKMHGPALHQEALQTTIREAMDKLVADHQLRPAMQPAVSLGEGYEEGKDAELTVASKCCPRSKPLARRPQARQAGRARDRRAGGRSGQPHRRRPEEVHRRPEGAEAKDGDQLIIDFLGKLDGEPFEGGAAEDQPLEIGAGRFIPGFEEQLVGAKAGDEKVITVTFPEDYPAANLAGRKPPSTSRSRR
jgi:trigger factor